MDTSTDATVLESTSFETRTQTTVVGELRHAGISDNVGNTVIVPGELKPAGSSLSCDGCETYTPIKRCCECDQSLCTTCTKYHDKLQQFSEHTFTDIQSHPCSAEAEIELGKCTKHDAGLDYFCSTCTVLICLLCRPDHTDHTLHSVETNPSIYHTICSETIKQLQETLTEFEDAHITLEEHIKSYGDAIVKVNEWEMELLNKIRQKATLLREQLKVLRDNRYKMLHDKVDGVIVRMREIEKKVSYLDGLSHSVDYEKLSQELATSQQIIESLGIQRSEVDMLPGAPTISDILPNITEMTSVDNDIDMVFSLGDVCAQDIPNSTYDSTNMINNIVIPNPDTRHGSGYKLCKPTTSKRIILHGISRSDIRVLDVTNGTLEQHKSDCDIWDMIAVADAQYIAINDRGTKLFLLDPHFKRHFTQAGFNGYRMVSLGHLSSNRFVLFERNNSVPYKVRLSILVISGQKITAQDVLSVSVEHKPEYLAVHGNKKYVTLCSQNSLYKISLIDGRFTSHDISYIEEGRWSCSIDAHNNTLIGDGAGNINLFDKDFKHKVIMRIEGKTRDMIASRGRLIITTTDNRILVYA